MNLTNETHFRGWAKPGPAWDEIPGPSGAEFAPGKGETLDAIAGNYKLFQLKKGHRFSTDDVLTAWYGTAWAPCPRRVLDLGSGIGTVAMISAWRLQGAHFVTVEAQDASVELARKSARYNGVDRRFDIRHGDFRDSGILRADEKFDLVTGSPPYFPVTEGIVAEHPQKAACRFEMRGSIADYCEVASRHLAPGGVFACVFPIQPAHQRARVDEAARASGMTIIREREIILREGEPPLLGLFLLTRDEFLPEEFRGKTWREPALVIRTAKGEVHPEYSAVKLSFGFPP